MIYIDISIKEDENLKNELMDVITMTSYIETRENELKNTLKIAEQELEIQEQKIQIAQQQTEIEQQKIQ